MSAEKAENSSPKRDKSVETRRTQDEKNWRNIRFQLDGAGASVPEDIQNTATNSIPRNQKETLASHANLRDFHLPTGLGQVAASDRRKNTHARTKSLKRSSLHHSKQFVPFEKPLDAVEIPEIGHPRFSLETKSSSPLYTGGATLDGEVSMMIDGGKYSKRNKDVPLLSIGSMTVDLIGVESWNGKHNIFRNLTVNVINEDHPPPSQVLAGIKPVNGFWTVLPSCMSLPFQFSLPVKVGPPPYLSKYASIRYILCATAGIKVMGRKYSVRDSCDIAVLEVHNPDRDLASLPEPLTASDKVVLSKTLPFEEASLTALLNREVWASGMSLFVELEILNRSRKVVKKIELLLERTIMLFQHAPAEITKGVQRHSRLPDRVIKRMVTSNAIERTKSGWHGIAPQTRDNRTWLLDIPPGLATIPTGRFFGVRYFLHASLRFSSTKRELSVRIPLTIIDPNSLSIASNLIAEVATALDEINQNQEPPEDSPKEIKEVVQGASHDTAQQRLSTPETKVKDSWAWTPPRSPCLSLVPSPLLPSATSRITVPIETPGKYDNITYLRKDPGQAKSSTDNRTKEMEPPVDVRVRPAHFPRNFVSFEQQKPVLNELSESDMSALRFPPRHTLGQMEPSLSMSAVDPETIADLAAEVEKSPRKVPPSRPRPRGIFFDRDVGRMTLPMQSTPAAKSHTTGSASQPAIMDFPGVDGGNQSPKQNHLSSTLAEEASHNNQAFTEYHYTRTPAKQRIGSVIRPPNIRSRSSKIHRRARSRAVFVRNHSASQQLSSHEQYLNSLHYSHRNSADRSRMSLTEEGDALWETIDEDMEFGEPGPDIGDIDPHSSKRHESLLKVENWDNGSRYHMLYDSNNMF